MVIYMETNEQTSNQQPAVSQTYDPLRSWEESVKIYHGDCEEDATIRALHEYYALTEEQKQKVLQQHQEEKETCL